MGTSRGFWVSPLMEAEQKLWVAVLETALHDALSYDNPSRMETARRWFREGGQNFKLVCDLANFDAGFVQKKILSVIEQEGRGVAGLEPPSQRRSTKRAAQPAGSA
ncbi:MAG: hypothetical protein HQL80_11580 [Magnetococcales bacterium]|nr:hypothetical protein [Magnetococcales bacterium]